MKYLRFCFSGGTTFIILGHLADFLGVDFDDVVKGGPALVFVTYPFAIAKIFGSYSGAASCVSVLLFVMLQCLGVGSVAIQSDSITANLYKWISQLFPDVWLAKNKVNGLIFLQFIVCACLCILGIPYVMPVSFKVHIF